MSTTGEARAEDIAPVTATLQCDRAVEPGRVRCTVEARTAPGRTLQWADVVIVELPELAQALKGRLTSADSISHDATTERWAFGLVAKKTGEGEAKIRLRAILCESSAAQKCTSVTIDAKTLLHVG